MSLARELDRHYVTLGYPDAVPAGAPHEVYDREVSDRAISAAKAIVKFVEGLLGSG
ncbi:MAG: HEPN domain-containing protein [Candidatus Freyarchaeota archaeon]